MNIYFYDEDTKEYLYAEEAEADPEETKVQGKFIPLVPANATLLAPYQTLKDEVNVFEEGMWVIKPDYRSNFYKVDSNLGVTEITTIGEQEGFIVVTKELGEDIRINPENYKIVNSQVTEKTPEDKAKEEAERIATLSLTGADVERGLVRALNIDFDDIVAMVQEKQPSQVKIIKAELKANNFYRGNSYVNTIGTMLGLTKEQLDLFFEDGNYEHLLPPTSVKGEV